jgi:hypothetical protein
MRDLSRFVGIIKARDPTKKQYLQISVPAFSDTPKVGIGACGALSGHQL